MNGSGGSVRGAAVAVTVALVLACAASAPPAEPPGTAEIAVGDRAPQDRPGIGWPGRGDLAHDQGLRQAVATVLRGWVSPSGRPVYRDGARLVWGGRVEGHVLALVSVIAATDFYDDVPELWTVELSGPDVAQLTVTAFTPGLDDLDYDPPLVLPVRSPCCGPRYAVSDDVLRLEHATAAASATRLALHDGLSERLATPPCVAGRLMVSTDRGTREPFVDLGQGAAPVLPTLLDGDPSDGGSAMLLAATAVDTCAADGLLAEVAQLQHTGGQPLHRVDVLTSQPADLDGPGTLSVLGWTAVQDGDVARHVIWQPERGPAAVAETVDGRSDLTAVPLLLAGGPATAVVWVGEPLELRSVTGGELLFGWRGRSRSDSPRSVGVAVLRGPGATEATLRFRSGWTGRAVQYGVELAG